MPTSVRSALLRHTEEHKATDEPVCPSPELHPDFEGRKTEGSEYSLMLQRGPCVANPKPGIIHLGEVYILQEVGLPRDRSAP